MSSMPSISSVSSSRSSGTEERLYRAHPQDIEFRKYANIWSFSFPQTGQMPRYIGCSSSPTFDFCIFSTIFHPLIILPTAVRSARFLGKRTSGSGLVGSWMVSGCFAPLVRLRLRFRLSFGRHRSLGVSRMDEVGDFDQKTFLSRLDLFSQFDALPNGIE